MKTILAALLLCLFLSALGHAEEASTSDTITIRYVEGYQDSTVLGRIYAVFQSEGEGLKRFGIHVWPGPDPALVPNRHNILKLLQSFPTIPKEVTKGRGIQRVFEPAGILTFQVPANSPEESIQDWKIQTLRINQAEQAGTGQPATRPESKSEGSAKPQPEAEGRSR